jgi:hypothetical protein
MMMNIVPTPPGSLEDPEEVKAVFEFLHTSHQRHNEFMQAVPEYQTTTTAMLKEMRDFGVENVALAKEASEVVPTLKRAPAGVLQPLTNPVSRESHDQPLAAIDRGAKAVLQNVVVVFPLRLAH